MEQIMAGTEGGLVVVHEETSTELDGREVTALAAADSARWALLDGREVWRSRGGPWERVADLTGSRGNCILPTPEGLLVGASEAGLFALDGDRFVRVDAFDDIDGRSGWYTPWGGPPDSRSLARADDGTLFVNVHVGGIPRSGNAGKSWEPTIEVDSDVHQVLVGPGGLVLAATAYGLAVSEDGGDSWRFETEGLHATYCRAVALAGDTVLLTVSRSHVGQQAAVYRRPLAGGAFERCRVGLPEWFDGNIDTHCLAASGSRAAIGSDDGRVFASEDAGQTWSLAGDGLSPVRCLLLA